MCDETIKVIYYDSNCISKLYDYIFSCLYYTLKQNN